MATVIRQEKQDFTALRLPSRRRLDLPSGSEGPLLMGVLNITPDSFSDGGRWLSPERAVEHGLRMIDEGADLLDLGAESTRPGGGVYGDGAREVGAAEEADRLLPVLEGLRAETGRPLSIDTRKAQVARQALAAGGDLINDVSALDDPEMAEAVAAAGVPLVLMHSRGSLGTMQSGIRFRDAVTEIRRELGEAVDRAADAGVERSQIVVDPGIGFGKTAEQNIEILGRLDELRALDRPLLVGASRKSFIGDLTGAGVDDRLPGSLAAAAWAARHEAEILRVHDVAETVQFLEVWWATRAKRTARRGRGPADAVARGDA